MIHLVLVLVGLVAVVAAILPQVELLGMEELQVVAVVG
jgi:hypothetical protein